MRTDLRDRLESLERLVPADPAIHVRVGATYFSIDGVCGARSLPAVPVGDATAAQFDLIRQSVSDQEPEGGTPIVGGTILAYKHLYRTLEVTGDAHVILLTDGADSCGDHYASNPAIGPGDQVAELLSVQAPKAYAYGISTWVIGAPGSEPARAMLSAGCRRASKRAIVSVCDRYA